MTAKNIKETDLSKKIVTEEGVSRAEISADISEQLHPKKNPAEETLSQDVARKEGLSPKEIKMDISNQMGVNATSKPAKDNRKNMIYAILVIVALGLIAWWTMN
jgi:hypothetical protein